MIISGIKMPISHSVQELEKEIAKKCGFVPKKYKIIKKSTDARRGSVSFVYSAEVLETEDAFESDKRIVVPFIGDVSRPIVIGFGPAGLFCAYILAKAGMKPIIFERGADVDNRQKIVCGFKNGQNLDTNTNVQFGEGGAGTFSDGKLTTQISNPLCSEVLKIFNDFGAPDEICYLKKPHIGTDILIDVIKNLRKEIINLGGEIHFEEQITDIAVKNGFVISVSGKKEYLCSEVVLGVGHSARDTFEMLYQKGVNMIQKPFSVGVRIEHRQEMINKAQYGEMYDSRYLGAADYKLSTHLKNGRGVYTFCMCPGGEVIGAASEENGVVTNGMSYHARNGDNANSAVLVSVYPEDFKNEHPLAGVSFQREIENKAYFIKNEGYQAPCQRFGDFKNNNTSNQFGFVLPTYKPGVKFANLNEVLPEFVSHSLKEGIVEFGKKIKEFDMNDALLTGPETRSSSPVRIVRDEELQSNIKGLYPIGEGAGYAGGITSSAVDGIRCALKIIDKYKV